MQEDIVFNVALNEKSAEKQLEAFQKEIDKATTAKGKAEGEKLPLERQLESLANQIDDKKEKIKELQDALEAAQDVTLNVVAGNSENYTADLSEAKKAISATVPKLEKQNAELTAMERKWEKISAKVGSYEEKIRAADTAIAAAEEKAGRIYQAYQKDEAAIKKMANAKEIYSSMAKSIGRVVSRLVGFRMALSVIRSIGSYFSEMLQTNEQYTKQLAQLKGALATAFQPLIDIAIPALTTVLEYLTKIAQFAANVVARIFGTTAAQAAANAQAMNSQAKAIKGVGSAAKKASKDLASFDTIERLSDPSEGAGGGAAGGVGMDFSAMDEITAKMSDFEKRLSAFLLGLGAILLFSGASPMLGLGLMVIGAMGLAEAITERWGATTDQTEKELTRITAIISTALLAIGCILLLTGHPALGIGMIIAGSAGLYAAGTVNWNTVPQKIKDALISIAGWFDEYIAPIIDAQSWEEAFDLIAVAIKSAFLNAINFIADAVVGLWHWLGNLVGKIYNWHGENGAYGDDWTPVEITRSVDMSGIPALAHGAVIPPNAPFMAMLGDQRTGNNIEAPESLIRRIIREESGGNQEMVALLVQLIDAVHNIGDEQVGRMANRYNSSIDRVYGR